MKTMTYLENMPHTLTQRLPQRLKRFRRQLAQAWGRQLLAHVQVLPHVEAFGAARPPTAWAPDYADLAYLYRTVRRRRPRVILEFGSGYSTLIVAVALRHTGDGGILLSLESDPAWAAQTRQALPAPLHAWCRVVVSPLVAAHERDLMGHCWAARPPTLVPDLIYLDGPGMTPMHAALKGLCALDLLQMEPQLRAGCRLIVDGRPGQTAFLRQHFRRPWRFRRHHTMDRHVFTLGKEAR